MALLQSKVDRIDKNDDFNHESEIADSTGVADDNEGGVGIPPLSWHCFLAILSPWVQIQLEYVRLACDWNFAEIVLSGWACWPYSAQWDEKRCHPHLGYNIYTQLKSVDEARVRNRLQDRIWRMEGWSLTSILKIWELKNKIKMKNGHEFGNWLYIGIQKFGKISMAVHAQWHLLKCDTMIKVSSLWNTTTTKGMRSRLYR